MRYLAVLLIAVLTACGGGGGGGAGAGSGNTSSGNLAVQFSGYQPGNGSAYKAVSVAPSVSGLNGNRPAYRVASGSLPAGLTLDPDTGVVSGVLTGSGVSNAQIELSVQGFSGSLSAPFQMQVTSPLLSYTGSSGAMTPVPATTFAVGAPLGHFSVYLLDLSYLQGGAYGVGPLQVATGVTVVYRPAAGSSLPAGLSLDSTTGLVSGTPSLVGTVSTTIEALVTYAGVTRTINTTIPFAITAPTVTLRYTPAMSLGELCISSSSAAFASAPPAGTAVTFMPTLSGAQPGDVVSNFAANPASGLWGLTLDANTGVLSGTSYAPNNFCGTQVSQFDVTYTLTRGAYSSQLTTNVRLFQ